MRSRGHGPRPLEAPHARRDRTVVARHLRVVRARGEPVQPDRDHHRRDLGDVIHEEGRRVDHPLLALVGVHALVGGEVRPADRGIGLGDGRLEIGIVDDHPPVTPGCRPSARGWRCRCTRAAARGAPGGRGRGACGPASSCEEVVCGGEVDVRHGMSLSDASPTAGPNGDDRSSRKHLIARCMARPPRG